MGILTLNESRIQVDVSSMEENLLWSYLDSIVNITAVQPLSITVASAGSEFLTYAATKMYLALTIGFGYNSGQALAGSGHATFYDFNNVIDYYLNQCNPVWDGAAKCSYPTIIKDMIIFSRIALTRYNYIDFKGYRITRT